MKHSLTLFLLAAAIPAAFAADKVPLKTELPPPVLVGTPVPIKLPNLEPKPADITLMVPAGTANLALNKAVTSSDMEPLLGELEYITDGDKCGDEGCFVELGPGKQWVQIDLEASATIHAVWVWHFHSQSRAYLDVVVQISDDPDFISGVTTIFNNDHDNTSGLGAGKDFAYLETHRGRLMPAPEGGVKGRYVRLYSAGNTTNNLNHYVEIDVFGQE